MTRLAALPLLLVSIPAFAFGGGEQFAVSLSASATDPEVNHVEALGGTEFSVYLWLTCVLDDSGPEGAESLGAFVVADYTVTEFEALNGTQSTGTPQHVQMALGGCRTAPLLLGRWTVENPDQSPSGSFCLSTDEAGAPSCWVVPCGHGLPHLDYAGVTGFSVGDSTSCAADNGCVVPTAVEEWSWGRMKGAYGWPTDEE